MRIRGSVFLKGKGGKPGGEYTGRSNNYKVSADLLRLLATPTESPPNFLSLTSNQVGGPAELKHINKRRKRNQQGLPQ